MIRALGRRRHHDPRSLDYPAPRAAQVASVHWTRRSPILNQKNVGACVGFSAADWDATDNSSRQGSHVVKNTLGLSLYSLATQLDNIPGQYPPSDTGSAGIYGAQALVKQGFATGYTHAFGLQHLTEALQHGPVMIGMQWKTGCDSPDKTGLIRWTGTVRGGHELLADQLDVVGGFVWMANHWTRRWAVGGRCRMPLEDMAAALKVGGDCTMPS